MMMWDWHGQPDLDRLAVAIERQSGGAVHLYQIDTGSDDYAIVLSDRPLAADEVATVWGATDG
jgi:hypothetical protein